MTIEGVGETSSLADALNHFRICCPTQFEICACYLAADFRRLLQALQYFGQVVSFSTFPPAFASFQSAAHFFCRSRAAIWPALGSLFVVASFAGALACCCATAAGMRCGIGAVISATASAAENTTLYMTSFPSWLPKARAPAAGNRPKSATCNAE